MEKKAVMRSLATMQSLLRCPGCWGSFSTEVLRGSLFDANSYGILTCDCGAFPIVNGIPILTRQHNEQRLVALLRQEAFSMASSECLAVDTHSSLVQRLLWKSLRKLGQSNGLFERIDAELAFCNALQIGIPRTGAYHEYLRCRFSDPTFVAGEFLLQHLQSVTGWILDVPAGAGHFSWILRGRHPNARIVTGDRSFFNLLLLKKFIVPTAIAVCLDANASLPFTTAQFDLVLTADAWHYLDAQALFLHELVRIRKPQANIVVLHAHNKAAQHFTAGRPFSLSALTMLLRKVQVEDALILDEDAVGKRAWEPDADDWPFDHIADDRSPVFDIWIGEIPQRAAYPSKSCRNEGKWIVNPLYVRRDQTRYVRTFTNRQYQEEFGRLTSLLPPEVHIDDESLQKMPDPDLVRRRIVLFVPKRY